MDLFSNLLRNIVSIPDSDTLLPEPPPIPDWEPVICQVLKDCEVEISTNPNDEVLGDPPHPSLARVVETENGRLALQLPDTLGFTSDLQYAEAILHEIAHVVVRLDEGLSIESLRGERRCYALQHRWVAKLLPSKLAQYDDYIQGVLAEEF